MPADEFTAAHFHAIKACLEVADPGPPMPGDTSSDIGPQRLHMLAEEGLQILLQHHPELAHEDPMDQLSENDRHLLDEFIQATVDQAWEAESGSGSDVRYKKFLEWRQLMIERLTR